MPLLARTYFQVDRVRTHIVWSWELCKILRLQFFFFSLSISLWQSNLVQCLLNLFALLFHFLPLGGGVGFAGDRLKCCVCMWHRIWIPWTWLCSCSYLFCAWCWRNWDCKKWRMYWLQVASEVHVDWIPADGELNGWSVAFTGNLLLQENFVSIKVGENKYQVSLFLKH